MNRLVSFLIFITLFSSCSFDNKTGIWEDASKSRDIKEKKLKRNNLKDVFAENKIFNEEQHANLYKILKVNMNMFLLMMLML